MLLKYSKFSFSNLKAFFNKIKKLHINYILFGTDQHDKEVDYL